MKGIHVALLLTTALSLAACGGGGTPEPTPDTTPPSIVSITPANSAKGVAKDANIVVTFSEKMNQAATQSAYQSADLPAGSVTFSWNADGTVMTVNPNADLIYTALGKSYSFSLSTTATDVAGNVLPATNSSFKTFRQLSTNITSTAALDGWVRSDLVGNTNANLRVGDSGDVDNTVYYSFLSFDLSALPTGLQVQTANLSVYQTSVTGNPYTNLTVGSKSLMLDHVNYGPTLTTADIFPTIYTSDYAEIIQNPAVGTYTKGVFFALKDDLSANRTRSQYRLHFAKGTNGDGLTDIAYLNSGDSATDKPTLSVTYLIP